MALESSMAIPLLLTTTRKLEGQLLFLIIYLYLTF